MHSKSQQGKDSSKKLTQNLVFLQLLQIQNKRVVLCRNIVDFFFILYIKSSDSDY